MVVILTWKKIIFLKGSDITTNINHNLFDISTAIKEINKINNLEYVKTGN